MKNESYSGLENRISSKESIIQSLGRLLKQIWSVRLIRFLLVGGVNTLFGYLVYAILILLQVNYGLALLLATILGVLFNFITTGRIVFRNKKLKLIFRFVIVYGVIYLVNLLFLRIFDSYKVNMLIAGAIILIPVALLSYLLNKTFVFRR